MFRLSLSTSFLLMLSVSALHLVFDLFRSLFALIYHSVSVRICCFGVSLQIYFSNFTLCIFITPTMVSFLISSIFLGSFVFYSQLLIYVYICPLSFIYTTSFSFVSVIPYAQYVVNSSTRILK